MLFCGAVIKANKVMPAVVAEVIRKAPLTPEKVTFAWRMAVGPAIAKSTTVRLDADGTLLVKADSPAWLAAVRKSRSLVHIRMMDLLGEDVVKQVQFL
jgi:predicted nucleic acid-binding Zn ribbon protein